MHVTSHLVGRSEKYFSRDDCIAPNCSIMGGEEGTLYVEMYIYACLPSTYIYDVLYVG